LTPNNFVIIPGISAANSDVTENVQQRLNNGETPLSIYNSNNDLLESLYGKTYQGGLIFYLNTTTGSGLVVTPSDIGKVVWGCFGIEISGADGTDIGTGQQNTLDILTGCSEAGIAARLCADLSLGGYDDWHLPSRDELNNLSANAEAVANSGEDFLVGQGYWSSTEGAGGANFAYTQDISSPASAGNFSKTDSRPVRAVRAFDAETIAPTLSGFTFKGTFGNHHYYISNSTTLSWTQAKALADGTSGHMVTIGSVEENQFILNLTSNESGVPHVWIGLPMKPRKETLCGSMESR